MKFKAFSTLILLAALAFGCQKEVIRPEGQAGPELWSGSQDGIFRPDQQCGSSQFSDLVDGSATTYGTLEILNDEDNVYFLAEMNHGWMIQGVKVYAGDVLNLPKGNGGVMLLEEFPFQWVSSHLTGASTYTIAKNGLASCTDIVFYVQAVQTDMWGNPMNSMEVWGNGSGVLNGFSSSYCLGACGVAPMAPDGAIN